MEKNKYCINGKPTLWYVEWWDHVTHSEAGWKEADVEIGPMLVWSIGWVVREDDRSIYIINEMDPEDGQHLHGQVILKSTIETSSLVELPDAVHRKGTSD